MSLTEPIRRPARSTADAVLIAAFLAAICLPAVDTLLRLDPTPPRVEAAPPKARPRLEHPVSPGAIRRLFRDSKEYIATEFGFRRVLLRACNLAELRLFGRFSTPVVLPGRDGWLVYDGKSELGIPRRLTEKELEAWRSALAWRRDWCRERGIPYLVLLVPGPQTIYPETNPSFLADPAKPSRLDQLIAHLAEKSDLEVLDLRGPLREARSLGRLYHKTDTHWNELGAYAGYRALVRRLARWLPLHEAPPLDSFEVIEEATPGGDLAGMIGLRDVFGEREIRLLPKVPRRTPSPDGGPAPRRSIAVRRMPLFVAGVPGSSMPRALMLRDSFATALIPFLSEHFSRFVFFWPSSTGGPQYFPAKLVERERPDMVIDEFVERTISEYAPVNEVRPGAEDSIEPRNHTRGN